MRNHHTIRIKKSNAKISDLAFLCMLFLLWAQHTLVGYALIVVSYIPYIGTVSEYLFPIVIIWLAVIAFPKMQKHISAGHLLFWVVAMLVVMVNMIIYPKNAPIIEENLVRILIYALPMLFVGACYAHESHKQVLYWASLLGFLATLLHRIMKLMRGDDLTDYDMDAAYKILPSVTYLIYYAFTNKKLRNWVIAAVGFLFVFSYGTRGPILCQTVFLAACVFMKVRNSKSAAAKVATVVVIAVAVFLLLSGDAMVEIAEALAKQFSKWGFSTRIFDVFLAGQFTEGSGREAMYAKIIEAINEKPLFGHGLLGDQMILGGGAAGYYAHNLFLELWCQFGILFGTALILYFIGRPLVAIYKQRADKDLQLFLWMMFCINFVKLMFSGTYTVETMFFFMLGVCMSATRKKTPSANIALDTRSAEE